MSLFPQVRRVSRELALVLEADTDEEQKASRDLKDKIARAVNDLVTQDVARKDRIAGVRTEDGNRFRLATVA